jgi:chromosome segregation ATPase
LEDYYKRYFSDRAQVVAFSEAYESEFTGRKAQIANYDNQLSALKIQIDGLEQELRLQLEFLQSEQVRLNNLRENDPAAYNQAVPAYNQAVGEYNSDLNTRRGLVNQYNDLVAKRNQIASEEHELIDAIDSSLPTL